MPEQEEVVVIPIEKGIPVPPIPKKYIFPFEQMEVADSIRFPDDVPLKAAHNYVYRAGRMLKPRKFAVRISDLGIRCWRVE